jgi:hypothetical protein
MSYRRTNPLVAVLCAAPIVADVLETTLRGIADVKSLPADGRDTEGLLRALAPDAVVVDRDREAEEAARVAHDSGVSVVHVSLRDGTLRVLTQGAWTAPSGDASPEAIRNAVVAALYKPDGVPA